VSADWGVGEDVGVEGVATEREEDPVPPTSVGGGGVGEDVTRFLMCGTPTA
jgi:hypothetical protein